MYKKVEGKNWDNEKHERVFLYFRMGANTIPSSGKLIRRSDRRSNFNHIPGKLSLSHRNYWTRESP